MLNVGQLAKKSGSGEIFPVIMAALVKAVDEVGGKEKDGCVIRLMLNLNMEIITHLIMYNS